MKPLQQYFHKVLFQLFVFYIALNFWVCELFHIVLFVLNEYVVLNFTSMGEILWWEYGRFTTKSFRYKSFSCAVKSIRCKDVKSFR